MPRDWVKKYFVKANPTFDLSSLSSSTLRELFAESVDKFASVIDSSDPDLSGFRNAGGKLLVWHGGADGQDAFCREAMPLSVGREV